MKLRAAIALSVLSAVIIPSLASAQWQPDGVPVCTFEKEQLYSRIAADGFGGAILVWSDLRPDTHYDVYAQRLDASGTPLWTSNGVAVAAVPHDQFSPDVVGDGTGGAIITWYDRRSGTHFDIYAQRLDADGVPQWTADGIELCTAAGDQYTPELVADGAGGAIVTWDDDRTGGYTPDVYVQRVSASGVPQWTPNGVAVVLQAADQAGGEIAPDGSGGALVTWFDYRNSNYDVFVQRVNASGVRHWIVDGAAVCLEESDQSYPTVISDGAGGAFVAWVDVRTGFSNIMAQRVNAAGAAQWTTDGIAIRPHNSGQSNTTLVTDGVGGVITTWSDSRSGFGDIYAQRVNASGSLQWSPDGVPICVAASHQLVPAMVSDDAGGAIVTWYDYRSGSGTDIYAQRVDASGATQLTPDGIPLCTAVEDQTFPNLASDGAGGAIVTWSDFRNGVDTDIYAQRVDDAPTAVGNVPPAAALSVLRNYPNPFASTTEIEIGLGTRSEITVEVYDVVGRRVRAHLLASRPAGLQRFSFDGRDETGQLLPSGVYFYRVQANGTTISRKMVIAR